MQYVVGSDSVCLHVLLGRALSPPACALTLFPLQGFLTVGADLHFSKGLREVIEKYRPLPTAAAYSSSRPAEPSLDPSSL